MKPKTANSLVASKYLLSNQIMFNVVGWRFICPDYETTLVWLARYIGSGGVADSVGNRTGVYYSNAR